MDDILRRLSIVESSVTQVREDLIAVKADVTELRVDVSAIKATLPHLATKAELSTMETRIVRWIVGTAIAVASVSFAIAKFVK